MRSLWIAVWLGWAGMAAADPFCKPDAAELAALPANLAGDWQRAIVAGAAVVAGVPRQLPSDAGTTAATLVDEGAGIGLPDPSLPESAHFLPDAQPPADFALPGESSLAAAELLAPLMAESAIGCPVEDLPKFQAYLPAGQGLSMQLRLFVLSVDQVLLVTYVSQLGPVARPGTAVRVVLRYRR